VKKYSPVNMHFQDYHKDSDIFSISISLSPENEAPGGGTFREFNIEILECERITVPPCSSVEPIIPQRA